MPDFTELKQKHRATWASGDYDRVAQGILTVADHVVRVGRIRAGERVLDIACGTGNTALMARARGAVVTGLDLTPELLAIARKRGAEQGYDDITWTEGDAENLPFPDGAFDVVVSSCGLMFAPDQPKVAKELARVTRPGGRIAIQAWTREGGVGRMFKLTNAYIPPPPGVPSENPARSVIPGFPARTVRLPGVRGHAGAAGRSLHQTVRSHISRIQLSTARQGGGLLQGSHRPVPRLHHAGGRKGALGPRIHHHARDARLRDAKGSLTSILTRKLPIETSLCE